MDKKIDPQKFMRFMIRQKYTNEKRLQLRWTREPFPTLEEFTEQNNLYEDE